MCGRCFGTGLQNVKGLLRRPEATALVQKMQTGVLKPGAWEGWGVHDLSTGRHTSNTPCPTHALHIAGEVRELLGKSMPAAPAPPAPQGGL